MYIFCSVIHNCNQLISLFLYSVSDISECANFLMKLFTRASCKKTIQKALKDLFTGIYSTIAAAARAYALLLFTLSHHLHKRQNRVLRHAAYQLLTSNEKDTLEG